MLSDVLVFSITYRLGWLIMSNCFTSVRMRLSDSSVQRDQYCYFAA